MKIKARGFKETPIRSDRRRLAAGGYLNEGEASNWDDALTNAVKRFQANHGLDQTGEVSRATPRELNVAAAARAKRLRASAERFSRPRFNFPRQYVDVNVAAGAVEDDKAARQFTAIVGGKRHESPRITAKILSVDINSTWTVPASIIKKQFAPRPRHDPNYFKRQHIRMLDARGHEIEPRKPRGFSAARAARFTFRPDPGP